MASDPEIVLVPLLPVPVTSTSRPLAVGRSSVRNHVQSTDPRLEAESPALPRRAAR